MELRVCVLRPCADLSFSIASGRRRFVSMKLRVSRRFVEDGASKFQGYSRTMKLQSFKVLGC
uniref:Uncharacterized protein n=1 Tax=Cannabis sativa TaxID=3483 RepID=A0A803R4I2_CANSA